MKRHFVDTILAVAVLALSIVPIGTAVFLLGFVHGDSPCVMCWEERMGMILIALIGLFVLRYGPRPKYVGLSMLVAAWGLHMATRHTAMHAARDIGQGFSLEIMGAHTYTWALVIFWMSIVLMGVLLMSLRASDLAEPSSPRKLAPLGTLAMAVFLVVVGANIVQAFASTGPPPFMGQGDPVRFSFNPRHWVWSLEEYSMAPVSLRGRWAVEKPGVEALPADSSAGPIPGLAALPAREHRTLGLPLKGAITGLAHEPGSDRFLITTEQGVYITDASLGRVLRYTVVDPGFSVDLGRFAGAAFLDANTVMAVGENKSYVILRENDQADAEGNFRFFLESRDRFDEVSRSRLGTVRARMNYVMSLAFDPPANSLYTLTVPNSKSSRVVVSRFDRRDLTLSEEYRLTLAPGVGLALGAKRSVDEFYVTGATIDDGRMYAISAAYNTLLTIDLAAKGIVAAHHVPDLAQPAGIAVRGGDLYIVSGDGKLTIVPRPAAVTAVPVQ